MDRGENKIKEILVKNENLSRTREYIQNHHKYVSHSSREDHKGKVNIDHYNPGINFRTEKINESEEESTYDELNKISIQNPNEIPQEELNELEELATK